MTKIGVDVNGKPADLASVEKGVNPPVVVQEAPIKVKLSIRNLWFCILFSPE